MKYLLDSGDPQEYTTIAKLAAEHNSQLWGSTTNPTLIAKKLVGKKLSPHEAFALQKELVLEIIKIVPGAVSAEVYAESKTSAEEMIQQGKDIANWHERVVVKLPTTIEGFKARTELRKLGITINNTLVFSLQQVFAISLHEKLMEKEYGKTTSGFPCFISPFVGRLDDKGENGLGFLKNAVDLTHKYFAKDLVWMLSASVRNAIHLKASIDYGSELVTAPAKVYEEWFTLSDEQKGDLDIASHTANLAEIPNWTPSEELLSIATVEELMEAIASKKLDISHPLTDAGIEKFVADWKAILT